MPEAVRLPDVHAHPELFERPMGVVMAAIGSGGSAALAMLLFGLGGARTGYGTLTLFRGLAAGEVWAFVVLGLLVGGLAGGVAWQTARHLLLRARRERLMDLLMQEGWERVQVPPRMRKGMVRPLSPTRRFWRPKRLLSARWGASGADLYLAVHLSGRRYRAVANVQRATPSEASVECLGPEGPWIEARGHQVNVHVDASGWRPDSVERLLGASLAAQQWLSASAG
jgi:hypothetical protein